MPIRQLPRKRLSHGVTLIEMMIALVIGLIVSGAALALVVAVMKSNADTIRATRLTQELRATAEIIARDLRRARSVGDPVANVGKSPLISACNAISPATASASCVRFGYDCMSDATGSFTSGTFKSIGLAGGKVMLSVLPTGTAAPACPTTADTQLSSNVVTINSLTITALNADAYTIRLVGQFTNDPNTTNPLIRSFTQEVRIRSAAVN